MNNNSNSGILSTISKIFGIFNSEHKKYSFFIFFIFLITMFLETISITLFIPFVTFLLNGNLEESKYFLFVENNLGINLKYFQDTYTFIFLFLLIFLIKTIFVIYCNWQKYNFTYRVNSFIALRLYDKYLKMPFNYFSNQNSSKLIKNLNYEVGIFFSGLIQSLELICELIIILGIITFIIIYNFKLSVVVIFFTALIISFFYLTTKKKLYKLGDQVREYEQFRIKNYIESFNLFKEIKIFNNFNYFINKDKSNTKSFFYLDSSSRFIRSIPRPILELLLVSIFILVIFFLNQKHNSTYILETLGVFGAAAYRIMPSINRIISSIQTIRSAEPAVKNLNKELVNFKIETKKKDFNQNFNFKKNVSFINISFKYPGAENFILKDFNFKFDVGKIIGIKGKTGSGKSTFINLFCGLLNPTSGKILMDKENINNAENVKALQKAIGYVPQEVYLMDSSIKENILFGKKDFNKIKYKNILSLSCLQNFIDTCSEGDETIIGEKSVKISGGQSQRIGIARALAKDPKILILDEATNALDKKTEDQFLSNLRKIKSKILIIIISHDLENLKICDEIINIDDLKRL